MRHKVDKVEEERDVAGMCEGSARRVLNGMVQWDDERINE